MHKSLEVMLFSFGGSPGDFMRQVWHPDTRLLGREKVPKLSLEEKLEGLLKKKCNESFIQMWHLHKPIQKKKFI